MIIISKFRLFFNNGVYAVRSYQESVCPYCKGSLAYIGTRDRKLINEYGFRITVRLRRLQCTKCKKIHIELPDIIVPYHLYCYTIIECIYLEKKDITPVDDATYRRLRLYAKMIDKYTSSIVSIGFKEKIVIFYA